MAETMNEKLHSIQHDQGKDQKPEETKVKADQKEDVPEGTDVKVSEVKNVDASDSEKAAAARPKPVPKVNRRGNKQLMKELEAAKELAEGNKEKYTRLLAEFDNARQRSAKENAKMFDMGAKDTLEKLLPVVDNFERAIASVKDDEKGAFSDGVEKIYKQMMDILDKIGVKPMNCEGQQFDPNLHQAVIHIEDEQYGENVIVEEMQKGYMYKDTVLRHAMVKVAN